MLIGGHGIAGEVFGNGSLLALNYDLIAFSDPIWGEGQCDWENELECWDDIELVEEVPIAVEPVAPSVTGTLLSAVVWLLSPLLRQ